MQQPTQQQAEQEAEQQTQQRINTTRNDDSSSAHDVDSQPSNAGDLEHLLAISEEEFMEPWVDFIKRATHLAEAALDKCGISEWTMVYAKRKWRWAHRVQNQDTNQWPRLALHWDPQKDPRRHATRHAAHP
eukprot:1250179-Karenia_brevis.AAC.1